MGFGPELTPKQKARLQEEIKNFDKAKTLAHIEKNAVGEKDVNAYHDWLEANGNVEPLVANPDGLLAVENEKELSGPDLEILSAKIEINEILSYRQRQVWQTCMREGLSAEQAGIKLNLKTATVETYLKQAKIKVKEHFNA